MYKKCKAYADTGQGEQRRIDGHLDDRVQSDTRREQSYAERKDWSQYKDGGSYVTDDAVFEPEQKEIFDYFHFVLLFILVNCIVVTNKQTLCFVFCFFISEYKFFNILYTYYTQFVSQ